MGNNDPSQMFEGYLDSARQDVRSGGMRKFLQAYIKAEDGNALDVFVQGIGYLFLDISPQEFRLWSEGFDAVDEWEGGNTSNLCQILDNLTGIAAKIADDRNDFNTRLGEICIRAVALAATDAFMDSNISSVVWKFIEDF